MITDLNNKLYYAIGFKWKDSDNTGFYTYGSEIHHGSIEDATNLLDYVKRANNDYRMHGPYKIFKLNLEEVK